MSILHIGRDKKVDRLIELLQRGFAKTVMWGNVGGKIGEQMVRAAFAPIISFSQGLLSEFKNLSELYQVELDLAEEDAREASGKKPTQNEQD
jgi:hypothetical protein